MKKRMLALFVTVLCWACLSGVGVAEYVPKTIDSNGTWTDEIMVPKGDNLSVSIDPNGVMTLTLQKWLPGDAVSGGTHVFERNAETWDIIASDEDKEYITAHPEPEYCYYRLGCNATADYGSGDAAVRLGRDNY